MSIAVSVDKV